MSGEKKSQTEETVRSVDDHEAQSGPPQDWQPGFLVRFPWIGISALIFVVLSAIGVSILLVVANNKSVDDWKQRALVAPNVILGAINAASNIALGSAVGQGIVIAWWRRALKGTTVKDLHRLWEQGSSIPSIFRTLNKFSVIALAVLMTKLAVIDSTLLQRALTTYTAADKPTSTTFGSRLGQEFPLGYSGVMFGRQMAIAVLTPDFQSVMAAYSSMGSGLIDPAVFKSALPPFEGCVNGTCTTSVAGLGFAVNCSTSTLQADYYQNWGMLQPLSEAGNLVRGPQEVLFASQIRNSRCFETEINSEFGGLSECIDLEVQYMQSKQSPEGSSYCPGTLTTRTCQLRPAIVRYPITQYATVARNGLSIDGAFKNPKISDHLPVQSESVKDPSFVRWVDVKSNNPGTLGGIGLALDATFSSTTTTSFEGPYAGWTYTVNNGSLGATYYAPPFEPGDGRIMTCNYTFPDPTDDILRKINQIMFLASVQIASKNASIALENNDGQIQKIKTFYNTNYAYLAGAVATMIITVLGVLPSYWGFWQLGRKVTLGPLDIASAFQAPLLVHPTKSGADVDGLVKDIGDRRVQYGQVVEDTDAHGRLAIAPPHAVQKPAKVVR